MLVREGETFSETLTMTREEAKSFSRAARDFNPLHLDEDFAARSRYKKLIVSGTQMTALHALQDHVITGLQRQMQMRHQPLIRSKRVEQIRVGLDRVEGRQPKPLQLRHML